MVEHSPVSVALAILEQNGKYLMQLRDDKPNIIYPGHWGLFGGHLEPGESADQGVRRELLEEIGYCPADLNLIGEHNDAAAIRYVFYGSLEKDLSQLVQTEGMDMAWVTLQEVQKGDRYSAVVQETRPLAKPAREILLNFVPGMATSALPSIVVRVNGKQQNCPAQLALPDFLAILGMNPRLVAVEYNGEILHRQFWENTEIKSGDCLEIVTIVGGG
jgi:8-oxo-dGTP diphosphatase